MQQQLNVDPRAKIKSLALLRCGHGSNFELFEFDVSDQVKQTPKNSDVGGHHLAFYVDNIEEGVAYLKQCGIKVLGDVVTLVEGPAAGLQWIYFLSPWGMALELVSAPKGLAYEGTATRMLWKTKTPAE